MKEIDLRTSKYFSGTITFLGFILAIIGLVIVFNNTIAGFILFLISVIIFSTHYRLKIDSESKTFFDYLWILGLKNGERGKFEEIQYLFVTKSKVNQTMNYKSISSTIREDEFTGYLKLSDDKKLHIVSKNNKKDVIKKLKEFSSLLNVKVIDYSEGTPIEI